MNTLRAFRAASGFTIVEITIVIVVIGILAGIAYIGYGGIQRNAGATTVKNDLANTSKEMTISFAYNQAYPDVLPADIKASPNIELKLVKSTGGYSGLTNVQNGVLFHSVCQSLVNEGVGTGTNNGGGTEQYISGCLVYNKDQIHINGWKSNHFSTPIGVDTVKNWYNANVSYDSYRPNMKDDYKEFAEELSSRFLALGGTFPVTSFWDDWATPTNGGVMKATLPAPQPGDPLAYCVEATHTKYNITMHITNNSAPLPDPCPAP